MFWLTTISRNYNEEEEDETKKGKINDVVVRFLSFLSLFFY
jgi:hypothetical protein